MPDLTTQLAKFLDDLYAGVLGANVSITALRVGDGSAAAPSYSFASDPNSGFWRQGEGTVSYSGNAVDYVFLSPGEVRLRDNTVMQWGSSGMGSPDVSLSRGAANRLTLATGDVFNLAPTAFASLPTGAEGNLACVTDSNTAVFGATIAGGGANNVLAFHNGTNWTVAGA
jgi:hypothetical protein